MSVSVRASVSDRIVFSADTSACNLTDAEAIAQLWVVAQMAYTGAHVTLTIEQPNGGRWTFYGSVEVRR